MDDREYLDAVHGLPCCVCGVRGETVQANHAGRKPGMGLKCSDRETIPMCWRCHGEWTNPWSTPRNIFRDMTKSERREWADARIRETQAALAGA